MGKYQYIYPYSVDLEVIFTLNILTPMAVKKAMLFNQIIRSYCRYTLLNSRE